MDDVLQDLGYSARQLLRRPGFTAVLIATLALGIGANTAVFSVVNGVLLRPLPYPEPDELGVLWSQFPTMDLMEFGSSWPEYDEFRSQQSAFEEVGGWYSDEITLTGGDRPERVPVAAFTASMWSVLDRAPRIGRVFTEEEGFPGRDAVVVLSDGLWQRAFGADPAVLGTSIQLDGVATVVLGVMPPDFEFSPAGEVAAWIPMAVDPADPPGRANHFTSIAARLAPGTTWEAAEADLDRILARWTEDSEIGHTWRSPGHPAFIRPMHEQVVGGVQSTLVVLLAAVGLVLLIACANVANLLLARGEARQREVAIRSSMGASRRRVLRQFVTESLLLAVVGGVAGVALAVVGVEALLRAAPDTLPRLDQIGLDRTVLAFSAGITLLAGLLFGVVPAVQAAGGDLQQTLRDDERGGTSGRRRLRIRQLLVVSEMSLSIVLLVVAGLLMQSFWRLQSVDPGFEADGTLAFEVTTTRADYPEELDVTGFFQEILPRLAALPGVESATAVRTPPLSGSLPPNDLDIEGYVSTEDSPPLNGDIQVVAPGYFEALGIELASGRTFGEGDHMDGQIAAIIDEVLAARFYPGQDPIGRRIRQPGAEWSTIVGVVRSVHQQGLDIEPRATMYLAHAQTPATWSARRDMTLLLRTSLDPLALTASAREVVASIDANVPLANVTTMAATRARSTANERFSMLLQLVFALTALLLAAVGIYGVLSYSVARRSREIGIRMALGARGASIRRLVVGQGLMLVLFAVFIGVAGALAAGRLLSGLLFEISPHDPLTYTAVVGVLTLVAGLACYVPAYRASTVSPQIALRSD